MANFALVDGDTVVNVIVAESKTDADALSGMAAVAIKNGKPGVGWYKVGGVWRSPAPFPSWEWGGEDWVPPVPYPASAEGVQYTWDEALGDWIEYVAPESKPEPVAE